MTSKVLSATSLPLLVTSSWTDFQQSLTLTADIGYHRISELLVLITLSFGFFFLLYLGSAITTDCLFASVAALPKPMLTHKKRVDYNTRVVAIIHAAIVTVLAYYGCFVICEGGQNIFTSWECMSKPKVFHVLSAIITIGYLSFDLMATACFVHENNTLTW